MSVVETILVFVVVPAAVVGVMALLIWGRGSSRGPRYRPGREWPYEPVWYAPHPLAVQDLSHDDPTRRPQLGAGVSATTGTSAKPASTAAGGARGTW
ncbi:MAG: aa3-type cytochrome oxidase subunit CtaJ [Geodermatophilaceae bacterium]